MNPFYELSSLNMFCFLGEFTGDLMQLVGVTVFDISLQIILSFF